MKKRTIILLAALSLSTTAMSRRHSIGELRCEYLLNPVAIDNTNPRLSWTLESNKNGTVQTAYQIIAASSPALLDEKNADLWNTGKVNDSQQMGIRYAGKGLTSRSQVYWKVRTWDKHGKASAWSKVGSFGIGLCNAADWSAQYIGMEQQKGDDVCPILRTAFTASKQKGNKTLLHVNSLGYHEAYINGQAVTDAVLQPAVTQFSERSLIVTYDVTRLLHEGQNDLVILAAKGWYQGGLPGVVNGGPYVRAQLEQLDKQGTWQTLAATNATWKATRSGRTTFGDYRPYRFGGETIDARCTPACLCADELDKLSWQTVTLPTIPEHKATPQMVELNRKQQEFKPVSCKAVNDSTFVYDMGTCFTGWTQVRFAHLDAGQRIRLRYSDHLTEEGLFAEGPFEDRYIAAGREGETFQNRFNYKAYRYLELTGLTEAPDVNDITGFLIHTDYSGRASFECSDEDMNRIHNLIYYTLRCLTLGGDMVDCPTIERLGYGGDGNASTPTLQTMFNVAPLYANWMQAWGDCQRPDGSMPHTAPNPYKAGGGPFWCGFIVTASWNTYVQYGDRAILERYYPNMQRWIEYAQRYSVDGLLKPWPETDYRWWYLGDWATPQGMDPRAEASVHLVNNCFLCICLQDMAKIANVLGKQDDANRYATEADKLKALIHQTFYDPQSHTYSTATQIDMTYPMLAGITPANELANVTAAMKTITENEYAGHLSTGLVGVPVVTQWATQACEAEWMYGLLKKRDCPSYLYMLDNDATTTWEYWFGRRSYIHNCYNGIGSWFYQALAGIMPDENNSGMKNFIVHPQLVNNIDWVRATQPTPYGDLRIHWYRSDNKVWLELHVPVGCTATITTLNKIVPSGDWTLQL